MGGFRGVEAPALSSEEDEGILFLLDRDALLRYEETEEEVLRPSISDRMAAEFAGSDRIVEP